jgi:hypothetical protein
VTPRSTVSTALWEGFLWMGRAGRVATGLFPSHPRRVPGPFNLRNAVDPANRAGIGVFPPFSQPYCYGFEDSPLRSYALSFLPAAPRTQP